MKLKHLYSWIKIFIPSHSRIIPFKLLYNFKTLILYTCIPFLRLSLLFKQRSFYHHSPDKLLNGVRRTKFYKILSTFYKFLSSKKTLILMYIPLNVIVHLLLCVLMITITSNIEVSLFAHTCCLNIPDIMYSAFAYYIVISLARSIMIVMSLICE